jgi:hypothetical protein
MAGPTNVITPGGVARSLDEEQLKDVTSEGSPGGLFQAAGEEQTANVSQREVDRHLAEKGGALGTGMMGAFSGLTMGFGPAGLVKIMEGFGDKDAPLARHMMSGAEDTDAGKVGKLGGFLAGSVITGGVLDEAAAATRLASLLPEAGGIMGSAIRGGVSMGARGAVEGGIIGLGNAAEEAALKNKGLSAEAILARMGEGALVGGGLGAAFGTVGGAARGALSGRGGSIASALGRTADKETAGLGMLREMGAGGHALRDIGAMEGGMPGFLERAEKGLESQGLRLSSNSNEIMGAAVKLETGANKLKMSLASEFDRIGAAGPSWDNFTNRVRAEVVGDIAMAPGGLERANQVNNWLNKMAPVSDGSFSGWVKGRELMSDAAGLPADVGQKVRAVYQDELNQAMLKAESMYPELNGATGRYQSMELQAETFKTLQGVTANQKAINASRGVVRGDDVGAAVAYGLAGHPIAGMGYAAGRVAMRSLAESYGPAMAEAVWKMSTGQKVTSAVTDLNSQIADGIKGFIKASNTARTGEYMTGRRRGDEANFSRKNFDRELDLANKLMIESSEERYKNYLKHTGSMGLSEAMVKKAQTAADFMQPKMPASKGARQAATLRPMIQSQVLSPDEHKFLRSWGIVKNPLSALHDMKEGKLSKDSVDALKTVWPETYTMIVAKAQEEVATLKASGATLPMDKITQLSILLDAPLDSTLQKTFIDPVQMALNEPPPAPPKPQPSGAASQGEEYATPAEEAMV